MLTNKEKVAKYKLIARDALRMDLIKNRQTKIADIEAKIKDTTDCKADYELDLKTENYEISKLDTAHPKYDKMKAVKEETVKILTETIKEHDEALVKLEEEKKEQVDAITKIEAGETKVSIDALNDLVSKMIEQDALNGVSRVE